MNTEVATSISKEEIEWVKAKHAGIEKAARRILKEAMEIGQWFVEADGRMGIRHYKTGSWGLWLQATFPEINRSTIGNYMRLANGREYLEDKLGREFDSPRIRKYPPTITEALRLLGKRDREEKESQEPIGLPPAEFEEPLLILRDQLKAYVYKQFQLQYDAEQIRFRIKTAKLGRRQIRQAVEWATQEHLEIREIVLRTFLPK